MSIKKLLSTGACMVVIGVSAGASYGLFQRLTTQVATPAHAQTNTATEQVATGTAKPSEFVAASTKVWTQAEVSDVAALVLIKPTAVDQPEPPLLRYATTTTDDAASITPSLPLYAHIEDVVILDAASKAVVLPKPPAQKPQAVAREVVVASAPRSITTPGTLRRFRGHNETDSKGSTGDQDGIFEQVFPPRTTLQPVQPRRPTAAASRRALQRSDRLRRVWSTGVYR